VFKGTDLLATMGILIAQTTPDASIAMAVTAPTRLEEALAKQGVKVIRTKADTRSLMSTSFDAGVSFAGDNGGGFVFPALHPGFDAPFGFAKLIAMLQQTRHTLSELADELPTFQLAYEQVRVPWEEKGTIMRRLAEENRDGTHVELLDGIKIYDNDSWVLVLPDAVEPMFHVYAESHAVQESKDLVDRYERKISQWVGA
jgi:mannose-1-phosphate guanylyltransferase/phosphomannomutase